MWVYVFFKIALYKLSCFQHLYNVGIGQPGFTEEIQVLKCIVIFSISMVSHPRTGTRTEDCVLQDSVLFSLPFCLP